MFYLPRPVFSGGSSRALFDGPVKSNVVGIFFFFFFFFSFFFGAWPPPADRRFSPRSPTCWPRQRCLLASALASVRTLCFAFTSLDTAQAIFQRSCLCRLSAM